MKKHLSPSMVVSIVALVMAMSGGAYAAATIDGGDIQNGTITAADIKNESITTKDIDNGTVTSGDIDDGTIKPADLSPATTQMIQSITINNQPTPTPTAMSTLAAPVEQPGPKGDKGEPGTNGAKGDKGDAGPQGAKGETGAKGPEGQRGEQGERGLQGDKGNKGDKGDTGQQGIPGPQGVPGQPAKLGRGSDALFFTSLSASDTTIREWTLPTIAAGAYVVNVTDSIEGGTVDATCNLNGESVRLTNAGQFTLSVTAQGGAKVTLACKGTGTVTGRNVITAVGGDVITIG